MGLRAATHSRLIAAHNFCSATLPCSHWGRRRRPQTVTVSRLRTGRASHKMALFFDRGSREAA
jgi:hypothetical protein